MLLYIRWRTFRFLLLSITLRGNVSDFGYLGLQWPRLLSLIAPATGLSHLLQCHPAHHADNSQKGRAPFMGLLKLSDHKRYYGYVDRNEFTCAFASTHPNARNYQPKERSEKGDAFKVGIRTLIAKTSDQTAEICRNPSI